VEIMEQEIIDLVTGRKLHVNKYCQLFAAIKIKAHLKTS
jgi:hypothetical protein